MSRQLHFLLIDNDREHAIRIEKMIQAAHESLQLEFVTNLNLGIERLAQGDLDGVFLKPSDNSSHNTVIELRAANREIPIIVLVTQGQMDVVADSMQQGAQEFLIEEQATCELLLQVAKHAIGKMESLKTLEATKEQFRESDTRMRAVLNASLDCIITLDTEGDILEFNPAAEETFGYPSKDLVGRSVCQLFLPGENSNFPIAGLKEYQQHGRSPTIGKQIEVKAVCKDDAVFIAEMAIHPVPLEAAPIFTIFLRNITARRRAEQRQKQYAAELERSNRDLEQYVSIVSHDLTAPLRAITGFCQRLQINYYTRFDEKAQECVTFIVEGARRMRTLIEDLRTYSRVTTKKKPIEQVGCQAIVDAAIKNLEIEIIESRAEIAVEDMPEVIADKTQLIQLFQNLIGNAIKYRDQREPRIRVVAERGECEWVVSICDNGIGFDPADADRIFEILQRLHADETQYTGTGIGLAVCKRIVERHQGRIWAKSIPGEGSSFIFTLPFDPGE